MQKFAVFFLVLGFMIFAYFSYVEGYMESKEKQDFEKSKKLIVMRKIAHDVLLYAKDSTSRILPAKQSAQHDFIIPFETQFAFLPDSLVNIINKIIVKNHLSNNYIVNVFEKKSKEVIFGYMMMADKQQDIIPCGNRLQASNQYEIHIKFKPKQLISNNLWLIIGVLLVLLGGILMFLRLKIKPKPIYYPIHLVEKYPPPIATEQVIAPKNNQNNSFVQIGKYIFYPEEQKLGFEKTQIILTAKETKLLAIFSAQINQVVDRERLQKEVWEDEGVIVGRSLDMFISKLRKKLEKDEHIKLINIHGKGYKLTNEAGIDAPILRD